MAFHKEVSLSGPTFRLFLWVLVLANCGGEYHKENQEQPLVSPSGKYVLTVPIETSADNHHYWRVTISDVNGNVLFKDDSEFVGHLNVYWSWDAHDRVWLNNSDNGYTYYWELDKKINGEGFNAGGKDRTFLQLAPPLTNLGLCLNCYRVLCRR